MIPNTEKVLKPWNHKLLIIGTELHLKTQAEDIQIIVESFTTVI